MAYVAMQSTHVTGGVANESIPEGRVVTMAASGVYAELPVVSLAAANAPVVFMAIVPPDPVDFPRPTAAKYYVLNPIIAYNTNTKMAEGALDMTVESGQTLAQFGIQYNIAPSLLMNPIAYSGMVVQLHRGGVYRISAGNFLDNAAVKVPGARVGSIGSGVLGTTATTFVGSVREYRDGALYVYIDA